MTFDWLKRYAPRSLYARAALILLLPVITIQLVVSIVFIQRLFEDVTVQMTGNVGLELARLVDQVEAAPDAATALAQITPLARALRIDVALPDPDPVTGDSRLIYDLSGRLVLPTLREALPGLSGIDLASDDNRVRMSVETDKGPLGLTVARERVSAKNPHQLLVIMVLASVLMTVIAYLFLKNQLRPIKRLSDAAQAFGRGRVIRYRPTGATEVRQAGAAFMDMRQRIERQMEQRTLMLSGVSHDLRTPLTRMRLALSMSDDPEASELLRDVDDMQGMLDAFLDFARDGALDDFADVDPAEILSHVAQNAQRAGHDVSVRQITGDGTASLQPLSITRALENLVGNAVRHGTRAELSLSITPRAVVFTVEDDGPGIPEDARERAMKPFARLDEARNQNVGGSVGLGLSIAMDIARQHGGILRLDASERLGGLRADIVLGR
ncbi:HAMP domain-containing protein [Maribius pontilimi]|uniref:histidine kinase n=1 Tax=Palleronia pontilimi TaxID=1964209 RepID=A0A934MBR8_9RHOB|nr:ATP-binding protein [Palleronia pontilimi]MBJ3761988.1 HAMP domain-containing protein [Palleronia pontilimi]